jgi:phosphate:Na+ symporter
VRDSLHILRNVELFRYEMNLYADSPNEAVRQEFDSLRKRIVILLRSYRHWQPEIPSDDRKTFLKQLKHDAKMQDIELVTGIDYLIRQRTITPDMGVSLINSSSYILQISELLINAIKTLTIVADEYNELEELLAKNK